MELLKLRMFGKKCIFLVKGYTVYLLCHVLKGIA